MTLPALREITAAMAWRSVATSVVDGAGRLDTSAADFGTYWIEAGHHIRDQVQDDRLLCQFLRALLPPYQGIPLVLYRGENLARYESGSIGLAWSSNEDTARMFASGLNAVQSGGVLLVATFEPHAIIAGPNAHSQWLGEHQYTVDPALASGLKELQRFPPAR